MPDIPEPQRRFQVKINIGADDMKSLRWAIDRISQHFHQDKPSHSLVSGGYDSGYWLEVREIPEQTHDLYIQELNAWLEQDRKDPPCTTN